MKEISIEDKARRYDEVIDKIADVVEAGTIEQSLAEWLFPELKESEDDRIRKFIKDVLDSYGRSIKCPTKDILLYEKSVAWLEEQGEQKPNCSKEAMKYLKENHSSSEVSDFQAAMNIAVAKAYDKGKADAITEMQNTAWSEEDENINQSIIDILAKQGFQTQVNWLKSLRDRVQPKQEWSAEDKRNLLDVKCIIDEVWSDQKVREEIDHSSEELESLWHWLDNIWQRVEYPQDTWKPSYEQMEVLWGAAENYLESDNFNIIELKGKVLESLYNDLKKLKG